MTLDVATQASRSLTYCDEGWQQGCGTCANCGGTLSGTASIHGWYCGTACGREWRQNHQWKAAHKAALKRDGNHCVRVVATVAMTGTSPEATITTRCGIGPVPKAGAVKGPVEVNHKPPIAETAAEQGYTTSAASRLRSRTGCWNHLDNLETLCRSHHREETARQREAGELG